MIHLVYDQSYIWPYWITKPVNAYRLHLHSLNSGVLMSQFSFSHATPKIYRIHLKMKILSQFTCPHVVPKLYDFLSSVKHKGRYFKYVFIQ